MKVEITPEMHKYATQESEKRKNHIKHHFEVKHLNSEERDKIGFLGEFACCELLKIDWKGNIRENYENIDEFDLIVKGLKIDVKTETIPKSHALKIINRTISDDEIYGRRLINVNQFPLLSKYDLVLFGLFIRGNTDYWYPIGFVESCEIRSTYLPTSKRPDGGLYPFPGSPVPTSILKPIEALL